MQYFLAPLSGEKIHKIFESTIKNGIPLQKVVLTLFFILSVGFSFAVGRFIAPKNSSTAMMSQPTPPQVKEGWKIFTHEYISFQYPGEWEVRDTITNVDGTYIYFQSSEQYNVLEVDVINNSKNLEPKAYYAPSTDDQLFDILRSDEDFQGYPAVRILGNINAVHGWPSDQLIMKIPERNVLVRFTYSLNGLKGGAAEQKVHAEFDKVLESLVIQKSGN